MGNFNFLQWLAYKEAKVLFSQMIRLVARLPKEYRFELGSQAVRAALSIMLNMAEGSGKSSRKDLSRFIDISLGSVHETVAIIDVFLDNKFMSTEEHRQLFALCDSISRQLGGFKKKLKAN